jgi:hypothetical protein
MYARISVYEIPAEQRPKAKAQFTAPGRGRAGDDADQAVRACVDRYLVGGRARVRRRGGAKLAVGSLAEVSCAVANPSHTAPAL